MIPIEDREIRSIYLLEISGRPRLGQREILSPVVARARQKLINHFRAKAEEKRKTDERQLEGI